MSAPPWSSSERVLLHGGTIYAPARPFATAMLIDGGTIAWLGEDSASPTHRDSADRVVDLRGALVTPGFVDAHVHATSTGLTLTGLDLSAATSLHEALSLLVLRARTLRGGVILGHGWDETTWPEGRAPTRQEIDRASWGSVVYLSRIDVHSAAVSSALAAAIPGLASLAGYDDVGPLSREAHHAVREVALESIGASQRREAHRVTRDHAGSLGVVALHEMAGPTISSETDLRELLALSEATPGPLVTGYWGELAGNGGIERAVEIGASGVAGDLFVDGAIGSHTAHLCEPYADATGGSGASYLDSGQIADHVARATRAGLQAGFHVIGDAAAQAVIDGFTTAAEVVGTDALRALGHRIEHAEMLADDHIATMARLGITASMQPMFDGLWGNPGGMYEQRLGAHRVQGMNRFADLVSAGVLLTFGSDAPVTRIGPWEAIRAAIEHHNPTQRLSVRAAFTAHTRAGWRAVGDPKAGVLAPGAPAHFAIWSTSSLTGAMGLPELGDGALTPTCLRTVVSGRTVFDAGILEH